MDSTTMTLGPPMLAELQGTSPPVWSVPAWMGMAFGAVVICACVGLLIDTAAEIIPVGASCPFKIP